MEEQKKPTPAEIFKFLDITVEATVSGYKSSEGDGRTAADIKKELEEKNGSEQHRT